jgi:hypothetical protein
MKTPMIYDEDGNETELPWKWEICSACRGNGTTTRHVECDGGGFTSSEWAEQDEEFREDYLAGRYDRPCPDCSGSGKVKEVDLDQLTEDERKAWQEQCDAEYECRMAERYERRMLGGC